MTRKEEWLISLNDLSQRRVGLVIIRAVSSQKALQSFFLEAKMAKTNLLSLGHLLHKGFVMTMEDNCLKMFDKNHKLVKQANLSLNLTFQIGMNIMNHQSFAIVKNKV